MKRAAAPALGVLLLLAAACGARSGGAGPSPRGVGSASVEWAGLRYAFSLLPSPADRIRVRASVRNATDGSGTWEVPWCVIWLRLYRDDHLVLDHGVRQGCEGSVRTVDLRPGEERVFHESLAAGDVLAEGTEEARFLVRTYVPRSDRLGPPRSEMEVTLGDVVLRRETVVPSPDTAALR